MGSQSFSALRGFKDLLPGEAEKWDWIESVARETFSAFGFTPIRTPVLETSELFTRSIGATSDIVEKETYSFEDWDGRKVSLRPEGTASVVRAWLEHGLGNGVLRKFYYLGPMFRHERPQAGRLRQFHQIGAEILGEAAPRHDVELLSLLCDFTGRLGIDGLTLEINTLGCPQCRPPYRAALQGYLAEQQADLCEDCLRRSAVNPLRVLDCKKEGCRKAVAGAPCPVDHTCGACGDHFKAVCGGLGDLGLSYHLNSRLVRGLDYYTRTAFEMTSMALGAQSAVAAGGRYDGLVEVLGGPPTPAVGFALGMERLALLMSPDVVPKPAPLLFIIPLGAAAGRVLFPTLFQLRQKNIRCEMGDDAAKLSAQLKRADRLGAVHALIVGDTEMVQNAAILRNMTTKAQQTLSLSTLAEAILPHLTGG